MISPGTVVKYTGWQYPREKKYTVFGYVYYGMGSSGPQQLYYITLDENEKEYDLFSEHVVKHED